MSREELINALEAKVKVSVDLERGWLEKLAVSGPELRSGVDGCYLPRALFCQHEATQKLRDAVELARSLDFTEEA